MRCLGRVLQAGLALVRSSSDRLAMCSASIYMSQEHSSRMRPPCVPVNMPRNRYCCVRPMTKQVDPIQSSRSTMRVTDPKWFARAGAAIGPGRLRFLLPLATPHKRASGNICHVRTR